MSAIPSELMQIVWLGLTVLIGALQVIASVLLLREQHLGPWLMLAGACISLLAGGAIQTISLLGFPFGLDEHMQVFYQIISGISSLGWLCFGAGLLIFALHRRSQRHHITELEQVVESQQS
jgi:hypothetical protein